MHVATADDVRVGLGFDVHRLVAGRPLRLGGVDVPFEAGLVGHSDGDVLLHAITDAVLGAAGLGDIGTLFPDTDPRLKGADSREFLREAVRLARRSGFSVTYVDAVVVAERPRLAPYAAAMAAAIRDATGPPEPGVSVKFKTAEGLGVVGAGQAMAAWAAVVARRLS